MPSELRHADAVTAALLIAGPTALLAGAFAFQYLGGLPPCEMCLWQRWALAAAIELAVLGTLLRRHGTILSLAALAILVNAAIAAFHVGVEFHWWQGVTDCAAAPITGSTSAILTQVLAQPLVRCDAIPWSLFGVSMAGWNAVVSILIGGVALWRLRV
jgi:disulfide bond formation protein DsbB